MGKLETQPELMINHSSHPHPLYLYLTNHQPNLTSSCSGCKHKVNGWVYTCTTCNYFLHLKCSQLPNQIKHPFHKEHSLSLLHMTPYPNGFFNCDACGKQGNGFSYHCKICEIDLHVLCASLPLFLSHPTHSHQLNLTFSPPYDTKGFSCDVCSSIGSNHWLYRCNSCGFDAHLACATSPPQAPVQGNNPVQHNQTTTRSNPHVMGVPYGGGAYGSLFPGGRSGQENLFLNQMLNGGSSGASQALVQALMGGGGGGSGGGGGGGLNMWNTFTGGGGGSSQLLQEMMGGGGLNQQLSQTMMGGGGFGGGGDLLQALMDGGGGGMDLLGGIGGGGPDVSSMLGGFGGFGF